ncbi:hypothetical protein GCM10010211_19760 [Streptomyces albospinus]|uniref:Uncharacterized protein n=1 Tax=Streptomyces albospinus TaxID=285515 RepID=A0ABQ2UYZ9_9ACTN|nr:hypothetical protein [Streptomyces albospinus]GGU55125.1 hypothetical protein GCM10010211_19760 [Streptomyces albospinus]
MPQHAELLPSDVEAITTGLLRLSQQIDRAECPADIAEVLAPIVDRHDGVLRRLTQIFEAVGDICNDFVLQDRYASELQGESDDAFDTLRNLLNQVNDLDAQFRTFAPHVTRTPRGHRPAPAAQSSASHDTPQAPSGMRIRQAVDTLADLAAYLREHPPLDDVLPLLARLLNEDRGVPIVLGSILRCTEHLLGQQSALPVSDETRLAMEAFREAAQEATDWHVLHWDVQRLRAQSGTPGR